MRLPWRSREPQPDRLEVLDVAAQANELAKAEAQRERERTRALTLRVARIHAVLVQEGALNGFTQRWEQQMRGQA